MELMAAMGLNHPDKVGREAVQRRVEPTTIKTYNQLWPEPETGSWIDKYEHVNTNCW